MNYSEWNAAITSHFFRPENKGLPVALQIDPDELAVIAGSKDSDAARADFCAAVRAAVAGDPGFDRIRSSAWRWNALSSTIRETPPPFVAMLAATVLAAFDMTSDPGQGISSSNYYFRLNAILGFPGKGAPSGVDRIVEWWLRLRRWLETDCNGGLGLSTAQAIGGYTRIGYALSQCTLRREDRLRLPDFFRWARLHPHMLVDEDQLASDFIEWMKLSTCSLTKRTVQLLTRLEQEGKIREAIRDLIAEYERWDGSTRDRSGIRRGEIALQADEVIPNRRYDFRLVPRRPDGFPTGHFSVESPRDWPPIFLTEGESGLYGPLSLEVSGSVLQEGLVLARNGLRLRFPAAQVHVLEADREIGGWVSRGQPSLGESCLVLVRDSLAAAAERLIARHAEPGYARITSRIPAGWLLLANVVFSSTFTAPGDLYTLEPKRSLEVSLEGGLKYSNDCWMRDALPVVNVWADPPRSVHLTLNGVNLAEGETPFSFNLNETSPGLGEHQLAVAGRTYRFRVAETAPPDAWRQDASTGWTLDSFTGQIVDAYPRLLEPGAAALAGATLTLEGRRAAQRRRRVVTPARGDVALIGAAPGQIHQVTGRQLQGQLAAGNRELLLTAPQGFSAAWLWWREQTGKEGIVPFPSHPPPPVQHPATVIERVAIEDWLKRLVTAPLEDWSCSPECHDACHARHRQYRKAVAELMLPR